MGRSYWFECSRCGFRATVAGRADRARDFFVQTIFCKDCKKLYDAVTRMRTVDSPERDGKLSRLRLPRLKPLGAARSSLAPPTFQAALGRLPQPGIRGSRWTHFKLQCPVSALHRIQSWNDPGPCPRCGLVLEKNVLPYRIWD